MACACPCFGDEADAEEKPNQMIQLDGLGMLRLDTQHVGQGSQGARSAKWFYFGETDNRLAVVNMLLCITCFLMWILAIWAVSTYYPEANPSEQSNNGGRQEGHGAPVPQEGAESILPININANAPPHAMAGNVALKKLKKEFRQYQAKHPAHITEDSRVQLEADKNKFKNALVNIKTYIECKGDDLTKLPEMIRESKKKTEKQLKEVKVLYRRKTEELNKKTDEYKDSDRSNQESIDKFKAELSSKEDLLNNYRYDHVFPKYFEHYNSQLFEKNVDLSKGMEEARKAMDGKRFNNPEDTVAYKKWLDDVHPEKYEEFLARTNAKSKDGDDSNENTGARNDEFAMNKSNDVDKQNVSGMNDDNQ
eukprot:968790_1